MRSRDPRLPHDLTLSQLLSLRVWAADGSPLGRVRDVGVDELTDAPVVDRVVVGLRGHPDAVVPWPLVDLSAGPGPGRGLRLSVSTGDLAGATGRHRGAPARAAHEVLLRRDVLDSQVVDLSGCRLSRVSEVLLSLEEDGGLVAVAVDLGLGSLLHRVGLGLVGRHLEEVLVAWEDLYLVSPGGHRGELAVSSERLRHLDAGTLAEVVARLRTEQAAEVLRVVDPTSAAEALAVSHHQLRRRLVSLLPSLAGPAATVGDPGQGLPGEGVGRRRFLRTSGWRVRRPTTARR